MVALLPIMSVLKGRGARCLGWLGAASRLAITGTWLLVACVAVPAIGLTVADTPELDHYFPLEGQTADYILVIDRSLSMKAYWPATAAALSAFTRAIPDGDHVAFVTFGKRASNSLLIPRVLTPKSRAALLDELGRVEAPKREATDDNWKYTDLGEAMAKTLDEINRPEANELAFVFILTDFVHDPAGGAFGTTDLESPGWKALVERGRQLRKDRALRSFGLILPVDGKAGRDIHLVRAVLGEVPEVRVDATTLGPWFERMANEVHREKLRTLSEADLSNGWEWSLRPDGQQTILRFQSQLKRLPLRVTIDNATLNGQAVMVSDSGGRSVAPGEGIDFRLATPPCAAGMPWWRRLVTTRSVAVSQASLQVQSAIDVEPHDEIVKVGLEPRRALSASVPGSVARPNCGTPLWLQFLSVAGVLAISAFSWTTWLRPAPPVRAYAGKVTLSGPGHSESLDIPADRSRAVGVGSAPGVVVRSRLDQQGWAVTLVSQKPGFPRFRPSRGLYAYRSGGQVFYRGREYDQRARRWVERDLPLPDSPSRAIPVGFQTKMLVHHLGERFKFTLHSR